MPFKRFPSLLFARKTFFSADHGASLLLLVSLLYAARGLIARPQETGHPAVVNATKMLSLAALTGQSANDLQVISVRPTRTSFYLGIRDATGGKIIVLDSSGTYRRYIQLNDARYIGGFDISPADDLIIVEETDFSLGINEVRTLDQSGNVRSKNTLEVFGPQIFWTPTKILSIGTSVSTLSTTSNRIAYEDLPTVMAGSRLWIDRLEHATLALVNPLTATLMIVSVERPSSPLETASLRSPELDQATRTISSTGESATHTLLMACVATNGRDRILVIPTGYRVESGMPLNEFDQHGNLIARFVLANPPEEESTEEPFTPFQLGVAGNHVIIATHSGSVALYEIYD